MNKKNITLIYGGVSCEHEVSLKTAYSIVKNVDYELFTLKLIYIDKNGKWHQNEKVLNKSNSVDLQIDDLSFFNPESFDLFSLPSNTDVVFPLVHGTNGEDGTLQGLLEMLNVPYVGSGVLGSSVGMDKIAMKRIFDGVGLPQCKYLSFLKEEILSSLLEICEKVELALGYPCFVKPSNAGSSVGITKAYNREELIEAFDFALKYDRKILVEETVIGRELEIGILGNDNILTSVVGEIVTTKDFYDYEAKYENQDVTKIQIPANIPEKVSKRISKLAIDVCKALDCFGLSRVDFFWEEKNDKIYINEINTIPGFTPYSMYPLLFKEIGIEYTSLITKLVNLALEFSTIKNTFHSINNN